MQLFTKYINPGISLLREGEMLHLLIIEYAKYKNREKNVLRDVIMEQDGIDWRAEKTFL